MSRFTQLSFGLAALAFASVVAAADKSSSIAQKVSFIPTANAMPASPGQADAPVASVAGEALVFSAPPHESTEDAYRLYQPLAEYLTRALARPVTYAHPRSWLSYQKDMARGAYDVVFDESHFNSWRITHLQHNVLAKLGDEVTVAVIVHKDNTKLIGLKQLAGQKICAIDPASLDMLAVLGEFDPLRQPVILDSSDWRKVYDGVTGGRCAAGVLPIAMLRKFDGADNTRTIHRTRALPNLAFSAGPRLTSAEQAKLSQALLAPEARPALQPLLAAFGSSTLVPAAKDEYAGLDAYLKNVWGYGR